MRSLVNAGADSAAVEDGKARTGPRQAVRVFAVLGVRGGEGVRG